MTITTIIVTNLEAGGQIRVGLSAELLVFNFAQSFFW
jgi:hypothetical protein